MASHHNLRERKSINWRKLHFGENLALKKYTRKIEVLENTYEVERLILKKNGKNEGDTYLVKWRGYPLFESTWEPKVHLTREIISTYEYPPISYERLQYAAQTFERSVQQRLSSMGNRSVVEFETDIFRFCFGVAKKSNLLDKCDFSKLPLSDAWFYKLKKNGRGTQLSFPVNIKSHTYIKRLYIAKNNTTVEKCLPCEKLIMTSAVDALWI